MVAYRQLVRRSGSVDRSEILRWLSASRCFGEYFPPSRSENHTNYITNIRFNLAGFEVMSSLKPLLAIAICKQDNCIPIPQQPYV